MNQRILWKIKWRMIDMKKVLTIAGSDCSGGAGIQADLKTYAAHGIYGMSVITSLTAQNTTGVFGIMDCEPGFVTKQIDAVFNDIRPDAVKIGMVSRDYIIEEIADGLKKYKADNIVLDPVMVSTSGKSLISDDAKKIIINRIMPLAAIITPNIPEAEVLSGISIVSDEDMVKAAKLIYAKIAGDTKAGHHTEMSGNLQEKNTGTAVLIKGGHSADCANDYLYTGNEGIWYKAERVDNPNTHGTGCTLSSAIACGLAQGLSLRAAVKCAKDYITGALKAGLNLGSGSGPLNHMYERNSN